MRICCCGALVPTNLCLLESKQRRYYVNLCCCATHIFSRGRCWIWKTYRIYEVYSPKQTNTQTFSAKCH